jgi:DNA helicase-4
VHFNLDAYLNLIRSCLSQDFRKQVTKSTVHKFKGLEKPAVIILDAVERSYPLIHPDWVFMRVFGDNLEEITDEERRLFYVALTRASQELYIITDRQSKSPFLLNIEDRQKIPPISWSKLSPMPGIKRRVVVRVGCHDPSNNSATYVIKELLKEEKYAWGKPGWKAWAKSYAAEGFSIDLLKAEKWAKQVNGIEVRVYDEEDDVISSYLVNSGNWQCLIDKPGLSPGAQNRPLSDRSKPAT